MNNEIKLLVGNVMSNEDVADGKRIKVRIPYMDNTVLDSDLPLCFPLLPKHLQVLPREGEAVFVFIQTNGQRLYIGPIISQSQYLNIDNYSLSALSLLKQGSSQPSKPLTLMENTDGLVPLKEEIAIQGRYNSDIVLKDNELVLRVGQGTKDQTYNVHDLAFIQLKYGMKTSNPEIKSTVNIVADSINLISHKNKNKINTNGANQNVTNDIMEEIMSKCESIPYGETLVEILEIFRKTFLNHTHPFDGMPVNHSFEIQDFNKLNFRKILNKNIKIN